MCAARQRPRKIAPNVSDTFDRTLSRSMNTAANPAVSSSDAGTSASSSRLRALLIARAPAGSRQERQASNDALSRWAQRSRLHLADEVARVVAGAELVLGHEPALVGGQLADRHAGGVVDAVEVHAGRPVVRQAAIDGHEAVAARADEVDRLRGVPRAEGDGGDEGERDEQAGRHATAAALRLLRTRRGRGGCSNGGGRGRRRRGTGSAAACATAVAAPPEAAPAAVAGSPAGTRT